MVAGLIFLGGTMFERIEKLVGSQLNNFLVRNFVAILFLSALSGLTISYFAVTEVVNDQQSTTPYVVFYLLVVVLLQYVTKLHRKSANKNPRGD